VLDLGEAFAQTQADMCSLSREDIPESTVIDELSSTTLRTRPW
jgi:hypothetical protein